MATTTGLSKLTINYLTKAQYEAAKQAGTLNENQLYMTPSDNTFDYIIVEDTLEVNGVDHTITSAEYNDLMEALDPDGSYTPVQNVETITPTLPSTITVADIGIERVGSVVTITIMNPSKLDVGSNILYTLPLGWRPRHTMAQVLVVPVGTSPSSNLSIRLSIKTTGEIELYNYRSSAITSDTNATGYITYICNKTS